MNHDPVNYPKHYTSGPKCECGRVIEQIQISETFGFRLGNVIKYTWRADLKGTPLMDLQKAKFYLDREIAKRSEDQSSKRQDPATGDAGSNPAWPSAYLERKLE